MNDSIEKPEMENPRSQIAVAKEWWKGGAAPPT